MSESDWVFVRYERVFDDEGWMYLKAWYEDKDTGQQRWVYVD